MKKSLFGLAAVTLAVGAMVWSTSIQARPQRPRNVTSEDAEHFRYPGGMNAWAYTGPVLESTGFEQSDGWNLGFMCDPATFTNCLGPPLPAGGTGDPNTDGNCESVDPNPNTGWYMSNSSQHCKEPHIDTDNPGKGEQHMRFSRDPNGGNPPGCDDDGFTTPCRITAFTPLDPTDVVGPTTISYMVAQGLPSGDPPWGSSFLVWLLSEGAGAGDYHYFSYYGVAYFYDNGFEGYYGLGYTSGSGVYDTMLVTHDPCNDAACYSYNGGAPICQSAGMSGMIYYVNRAIILHDNKVGDWDFDNYLIERGDVCPTYCDGVELEAGEECDPPADDSNCPGRCRPAGDPAGECTCDRVNDTCDTARVAVNGLNGPFMTDGGFFKYTADTPFTSINTCGGGFDSEIFWGYDAACTFPPPYMNDECVGTEPDTDPSASCYDAAGPYAPDGSSCLCVPTEVGTEYVFAVGYWDDLVPPPLGSEISFTILKKMTCGEPIPDGACCDGTTGVCSDGVPVEQCVCDQCTWSENKYCSMVECVQHTGACCDGETGICTDGVVPAECNCEQCEPFKDQTCAEIECLRHTGACCHGIDGTCSDGVYPEDCMGDQEVWSKGLTCGEVTCVEHTGACCDGLTGACTDGVFDQNCTCEKCTWTKGEDCAAVGCTAELGACCDHDGGNCTSTTMAQCNCEKCDWTQDADCSEVECAANFTPIPTVSEWGLAILALLLLVGAKIYFSRRQAASA
jgi:hypothetical protein